MSGNELLVFGTSAGVILVAGLLVRWLSLEQNQALSLPFLDFTKDLFAAAVVVFPTTLLVERHAKQTINFTIAQGFVTFLLFAAIAVWAKFDTRYFAYWRRGERRVKTAAGVLSDPQAASRPRLRKCMAFALGNGLGFIVLYFSTVISQAAASS
jgi:hypothetical protein